MSRIQSHRRGQKTVLLIILWAVFVMRPPWFSEFFDLPFRYTVENVNGAGIHYLHFHSAYYEQSTDGGGEFLATVDGKFVRCHELETPTW